MRPRHLLILVALAAVPIALALALSGGGAPSRPPGSPTQVSLELTGESAKAAQVACGATHHYEVYRPGAEIAFRGQATASGPWAVHLKLKACVAGIFEPAGSIEAKHRAGAEYHGSFAAPIAGFYSARAELTQNSVRVTRSRKRFFHVLAR